MGAEKVNGFAAPYTSQTFQNQAAAQTVRNGILTTYGEPVTTVSGMVNIPVFSFIQDGLIVTTDAVVQLPTPSAAPPYYIVVTSQTPSQTDDLVFTFARTPEDLTDTDIIVAAWDGLEWRLPQVLSIDGIYDDVDQANIDFGKVGPFSGLQTTLSGSVYLNSPGVIVDPSGLRQALTVQASFPVVVTDPDYPRVDRVVYRKPADSLNRIGVREFLIGGTYASTPQSSHAATTFSSSTAHSQVRTVIASDNTAHIFAAQGYGNTFTIYYTKVSADRTTTLVAATALQATTEADFSVAIDSSNNMHLVTVQSSHIYYQKFSNVGAALTSAILIDPLSTPSTAPSVSIDPASTKVFVAYQSLLGAANNQIFFTTRDLTGNLITAAANVTNNGSNLQNPSIFVTSDLLVYIAWEDSTFTKVYYEILNDIGVALGTPTYVSGNVNRIGFSPLTDGATQAKMRVADNKSVFVTFLQNKGSGNYGISVWNDGVSFMQTFFSSGENFVRYAAYLDSTFNGLAFVTARSTSTDFVKLEGQTVAFTLNLAGSGPAAAVATIEDEWGSMLHVWADPTASGYQATYQSAHIHDIGPAVVINGPNTITLTSSQILVQASLFTGEQPVQGDQITVSGSVAGNNGVKIISAVQLVTLLTTNDFYQITTTTAFAATESPAPNPVVGAFAAPNGNQVNRIKSTSELTASAFQLNPLPLTDILLARISMPGSSIVNYLPPGVTVALDATLFVPHGNNISIDWGATSVGYLTIGSTAAAFYTGTPTGASTPVTITADVPGTGGNSIVITFSGTNTAQQAIQTWNAANPSNRATLTAGNGTQVPSAGTADLAGGSVNANNLQLLDLLHDENYVLANGSYAMTDDTALYVVCDGVDFSPTPAVSPVNTLPFSTPIIVLGVVRDGKFNPAQLAIAAITQLDVGETDFVGEDLPLSQRERLGITSDTTYEAYGSDLVVSEVMSHPEAIGALDEQVGALIANQPKEAYWVGDGSTTTFNISTATLIGGTFTWSTNNSLPDVTVWVDGTKQNLDSTGATGFRKISTTSIQLAAAPDGAPEPSSIYIRREGTSYGGPTPPQSGNLWSDPVDANIVGPSEVYSVGLATAPMGGGYFAQEAVVCLPADHTGGIGVCKKVKYKKNVSGTTIPGGTIISVYSDGSCYPGAGGTLTGRVMVGVALADIESGFYGPVLLNGYNLPGVLSAYSYAPGTKIYVTDAGGYTDGSTGISNSNDTVEFVGVADCADNTMSGTATDLIFFLREVVDNP